MELNTLATGPLATIEYLSIEGGGTTGIAIVGFIKYIQEQYGKLPLKGISGSSIGSLLSLFIALNIPYTEICELLFNNTIIKKLIGVEVHEMIISPFELVQKFGIITNRDIKSFVGDILQRYTGNANITFEEFYKCYKIDLVVTMSNVSAMKTEFISYKKYPRFSVMEAIAISCSYPPLIQPTKINNEYFKETYFTDGGLFTNLPFYYFDETEKKRVNGVGILIELPYEMDKSAVEIKNFHDYISNIMNGLMVNSSEKMYYTDGKLDDRIIRIPITVPVTAIDTDISQQQKEQMIKDGYDTSAKYNNDSKRMEISTIVTPVESNCNCIPPNCCIIS